MQATCRQPNTQPAVHQHFHAIASTIEKEINPVRLHCNEDSHDSGERFFGAKTHVH